MTDKPDNPPAFPRADDTVYAGEMGMTLRDYFAGQALIGIIPLIWESPVPQSAYEGVSAQAAYEYADAMLAKRAKK